MQWRGGGSGGGSGGEHLIHVVPFFLTHGSVGAYITAGVRSTPLAWAQLATRLQAATPSRCCSSSDRKPERSRPSPGTELLAGPTRRALRRLPPSLLARSALLLGALPTTDAPKLAPSRTVARRNERQGARARAAAHGDGRQRAQRTRSELNRRCGAWPPLPARQCRRPGAAVALQAGGIPSAGSGRSDGTAARGARVHGGSGRGGRRAALGRLPAAAAAQGGAAVPGARRDAAGAAVARVLQGRGAGGWHRQGEA